LILLFGCHLSASSGKKGDMLGLGKGAQGLEWTVALSCSIPHVLHTTDPKLIHAHNLSNWVGIMSQTNKKILSA